MKLKYYLILYILFISFVNANAQNPVFKNYTTNDGLPSNEVYNCCQDKEGYMWFFTDRGISRYDGKTFTNYTTDNGLPDNFVNKYAFSPKGVLWVLGGLKQNKLAYFDGKKFVPFQYNNELQNKLKEELILNFSFEGEVPTYFGTRYKGLVYLNKKGQLEEQNNRPNTKNYRFEYYPDLAHQVIGAKDHLYPYTKNQTSTLINKCVFLGQVFELSLGYTPTSFIYVYGDRLFFSFGYDLFIIKNNAIEKHQQFASDILNYYLDKDSTLYVALDNNIGVEVYPHCDLSRKQKTIFNDIRTTSINQDREGGFWITSHNSGIYYIPSFALQEIKLPFLQEHEIPAGIQVANNNKLFVALHNYKLYTWHHNSWSANLYSEDQINNLKSKYDYLKNYNFKDYGNLKQLKYFPKQKLIQPFYSGTSFAIDENTNKLDVLINGEDGVIVNDSIKLLLVQKWIRKYTKDKKTTYWVCDLKSERGFCIYETKDKRVLVGTQNGVEEFAHDSTQFIYHDTIKNRVTQIAELTDSTLVFSTLGSGLYFYKKDSLLLNFKFPERYKRFNFISKMVLDNNILYLATPEGIAIVKTHFPQMLSYQFITFSSGFLSNDIKDITVKDSMLYFLSGGRVTSVNTQAYTDNTTAPPIFITHCTIDTIDATAKMNPKISEKQRIKIEFATLLFRANNNDIYQYRLLGNNDSTWRTTTQAFIEFTSLLAGEYIFEVKALNENNIASIQTARYRFVVLAPIWKRPWFMFMAGILMALITYLIYRRQIAINNEKNKIRELMLSYEQQALAAQINPHFIFNVITNIQSFVLTQDKKVAYNYLNKFARLMRISLDNSRMKWVSLQSEIELVDIYLELEKLRFARFKFSITCHENIDQQHTFVPSMLIQPFLENSVKHGIFYLHDKEGNIQVHFEKMNENIVCTIEDNGVGRRIATEKKPIHKEHKSAGQSITNKRMELLMNETKQQFYFEIIDKQGDSGTIVKFNIPNKISFSKSAKKNKLALYFTYHFMKKLQTILIDDEPNAIISLQTILNEYCEGIEVVATANGALEGIKKTSTLKPDLVFLDVDMPGGNGFDFLEAFPNRDFKVIFTTASSDHALKAIKAKAEDYLLKPVDIDELNTALNNLRAVLDTKKSFDRNKIALPTQNGYTYVSYHDIIHIDNEGNYSTFYLKDKSKHLISKNIGYFADLLDFVPFFRCHQSHIINLDEINELNRTDGTHVIMSNGNRIDVSRGKKDELYEVMGK